MGNAGESVCEFPIDWQSGCSFRRMEAYNANHASYLHPPCQALFTCSEGHLLPQMRLPEMGLRYAAGTVEVLSQISGHRRSTSPPNEGSAKLKREISRSQNY